MEKFEIEVKWGSYFFIINAATSILIVLLMFLIDIQSLLYLSNVLIPVFIIQLLYFSIKAILENRKYDLNKGFRKFFVFIRVLVFCLFLKSFLNINSIDNYWYPTVLFSYRKKDLSEFLIEDNAEVNNGITLNEFIVFVKRKFNRL